MTLYVCGGVVGWPSNWWSECLKFLTLHKAWTRSDIGSHLNLYFWIFFQENNKKAPDHPAWLNIQKCFLARNKNWVEHLLPGLITLTNILIKWVKYVILISIKQIYLIVQKRQALDTHLQEITFYSEITPSASFDFPLQYWCKHVCNKACFLIRKMNGREASALLKGTCNVDSGSLPKMINYWQN